tara:strand:+ start:634 stop:879 length:246 start_codon:yes stop_codon:yes gene_type:complete
MKTKIYILGSLILISLAVLIFNVSSNGFSFVVYHTYEIGSVRKPRQMEWTTINWGIVVPLIVSNASLIFSLAILKKFKNEK